MYLEPKQPALNIFPTLMQKFDLELTLIFALA